LPRQNKFFPRNLETWPRAWQ